MHARGIGHVLLDHLADAEGRKRSVEVEWLADMGVDGGLAEGGLQGDGATGEPVGIDAAQHDIGVGDGGAGAAQGVASGSRVRARALGTDGDALHRIDARQRAAAGTDLDHFDYRDAHGQAAALHEAVAAVDLEAARGHRLAVVDDADLGGRAAHVEGQDAIDAEMLGDPGRQDHAAGGTRFDQADGKTDGGFECGQPATRGHQQQGAGEAGRGHALAQLLQIAGHQRLNIGVGAGGREALVFAQFRADVARQRDPQARQAGRQDLPRAPLVRGVGITVQEADRDTLDLVGAEPLGQPFDGRLVQRQAHAALGVHALGHGVAQLARHQRLGLLDEDVVLLEAVLLRHLDRIAKAASRDQRRDGTLPFDDGIGRQRRAVDDQADLGRFHAGQVEGALHAVQHAVLRRRLGRQHLDRKACLGGFQHHIGEGAADIDGKAY